MFIIIPFTIIRCSQGAYCTQLSASGASVNSAASPSFHNTFRKKVHDSDLIFQCMFQCMTFCVCMSVCELINTTPSDSQFQVTQPVVPSTGQRNQELQGCAPTDFFHVFPCKNVTNGLPFVCRHVLFIQSQEEYLCMAWGLYCTMWIYPAKLGAGRFLVSKLSLVCSGEAFAWNPSQFCRTNTQDKAAIRLLLRDITIHQVSFINQVTKVMKQCNLCQINELSIFSRVLTKKGNERPN